MFTKEPIEEVAKVPLIIYAVALVSILLNIVLGLSPSSVLDLLG
jgi:NADH-quinone oxidoreductase subunit N